MKKALSHISSAVLPLVLTVALAAPASAQTVIKHKAGRTPLQPASLIAGERPARDSRISISTAGSMRRHAPLQTPSLHKALKVARIADRTHSAPLASAQISNLYGMCIYSDYWIDEGEIGFFSIAANGALDQKFPMELNSYANMWCGIGLNGVYYLPLYIDYGMSAWVEINAYDIETGELIGNNEDASLENIVIGYAQDPTDGTVYGIGYNAQGSGLNLATHEFSIEDGQVLDEVTVIAPIEGEWNSLVCDAEGQLYGISYEMDKKSCTSSTLCKIDKTTGEVTEVGLTGQLPQYFTSAIIDHKTGIMYWTVCPPDDSGLLCTVDLATGEATTVAELDGNAEIVGLYIAPPAAADDAPAAVENLAVEFVDGSLSGTVRFTAPVTLYDGTPATGALSYSILANREEVATGTTTFGADAAAEVTLDKNGEYTFQVIVSNQAGPSPAAKISAYVGYGVPEATKATLVYADGKMQLSWTPVDATVDGGYINPATVTYTVTRFPDEAVVASNISATTFEENVAEPDAITRYYYTVVTNSDDLSSAPAKSNVVVLGNIVPPYSNNFEGTAPLDGYTIIDVNADGKTWGAAAGQIRMPFNTRNEMDDWLITPPIKMEAGYAYYFSIDVKAAGKSYPERFEIKWGDAATAEAMTHTLILPTVVKSTDYQEFGDYIVPETTGVYYVGIHGISDANQYYLWMDNLAVSAGMTGVAPSTPTDIVVTPDFNGLFKAEITFKAPATDFSGDALTENLTKVEVSRGGEVIKTFTDVAPGAELSFTDELEAAGNVTYSFQAFNGSGCSKVVTATVFVGVEMPAPPQNITLIETATPGEVLVDWDEITTDYKGNPLNPALVEYDVCVKVGSNWVPVNDARLHATTYSFQAVPEGLQSFIQVGVFAYTSGGTNADVSGIIAAGTPYPFMEESFAGGQLGGYILGVEVSDDYDVEWTMLTDASGVDAQDGDNGYLALVGEYRNDFGSFWTGKIDLADKANPGLRFFTYNMPLLNSANEPAPDLNEIQIFVKKAADAGWTALGEPIVISELGAPDTWVPVTASLADFAGEIVQVRVQATVKAAKITLFDNIMIGDLLNQDLAAISVSAMPAVKTGSDYTVTAKVGNLGIQDATAFTLKIFADDEEVASREYESLGIGLTLSESFTFTMSPLATEPVEYYAMVVYTPDENTDNNTSAPVSVAPQISRLPAATGLSGKDGAEGVELAWSEPDLDALPTEPETVDFEDGESWAQAYAGWTFVDGDRSPSGMVFEDFQLPGITPTVTPTGFVVFDNTEVLNPNFVSPSGHKYLVSIYRNDLNANDDWAISPLLSGHAQTITFWAKSANARWLDALEMYYSTGSLDPADFIKVGQTVSQVPGTWTEYSFEVPDGATHFAVRSCSADGFVLMLDDFTFVSGIPVGDGLSIEGYDVYRDGLKLNEQPVAETEYIDTTAPDGSHSYVVITVYDKGISAPSNAVTVQATGIAEIGTDAAPAEYYNLQGIRVTNPEKGVLYLRKQPDGTTDKVRF